MKPNKPIPAIQRFRELLHDYFHSNGSPEEDAVMETFFESELLNERERILNELYEDLNFHHIAKRNFSSGTWDHGVHDAMDKVRAEIARKLAELKEGEEK